MVQIVRDGRANTEAEDDVIAFQENILANDIQRIVGECKALNVDRKLVTVEKISDLYNGDHIVFNQLYGLQHHAIVTNVNLREDEVTLIEYTSDGNMKAKVKENTHPFSIFKMVDKYIYNHEYDAEETIKRARRRLNEEKYSIFCNNCEHFATWAKTGNECSEQVSYGKITAACSLIASFGKVAITAIAAALSEVGDLLLSNTLGAFAGGFLTAFEGCLELKKLFNDYSQDKYSADVFQEKLIEIISKYAFAIPVIMLVGSAIPVTTLPAAIFSITLITLSTLLAKWGGKCFGRFLNYIIRNWPTIKESFQNFWQGLEELAWSAVKATTNAVFSAAKSTGKCIVSAAKAVGSAVRRKASRGWRAFKSWFRR